MNKQEKTQLIEELKAKFAEATFFYIADTTSLTVEQVNKLRKMCYTKGVEMKVAKNSLIQKALEANNQATPELITALKGQSSIMFSEQSSTPAKIIKEFRGDAGQLPLLKLANIESEIYIGNDQLAALAALKSRNELIADVILLLQSPSKAFAGALETLAKKKAEQE
jgi:large subunit ribosomal protein L10